MRSLSVLCLLPFLAILSAPERVRGQSLVLPENYPEYEIPVSNGPAEGYLFLASRPIKIKYPAYLLILDNYGTPVFYRYMPGKASSLTLQKNGLLSYQNTPGEDLKFYIMDSSFVVIDSVGMADHPVDGHDFVVLENGNYLLFGKDVRTMDLRAYGGVEDATVAGCLIRELDKDKNTVFEWNSWDHFQISDTYSDLTASSVEMIHPNSLDVDEEGNIFLISRRLDEVTKISRETGEIIWRLGGKNNQFSFPDSSHRFSMPHDFQFLGNGHYTVFDNGSEREPPYSRGIEYLIDEDSMTAEMIWEYDADKQIYGPSGGSTQRLPSGNTLIGYGGQVSRPSCIEVHPDGSRAFQLDFGGILNSGRTRRFPWRTNLFEPNTYVVNFGEWDGYTTSLYLLTVKNLADHPVTLTSWCTRGDAFGVKTKFPVEIPAGETDTLWLEYFPVNVRTGYIEDVLTLNSDVDSDTLVQRIAQQVKLYGTKTDTDAPEAIISLDSAVNVPRDTFVLIQINEPIRKIGGGKLDYLNVDSLIVLKRDGPGGTDVPFDAVISTDKSKITVIPDNPLADSQAYYIAISDAWEDFSGNGGSGVSSLFYTYDPGPASAIRNPASGPQNTGQVRILPNPGRGRFVLRFTDKAERRVAVYDIHGRPVCSGINVGSESCSLDLREQPAGIYIVRVKEAEQGHILTLKLVKN